MQNEKPTLTAIRHHHHIITVVMTLTTTFQQFTYAREHSQLDSCVTVT